MILDRVIKITFKCDFCGSTAAVSGDFPTPRDWVKADISAECPGEHYCSNRCYFKAKSLWERAMEVGLEAASDWFEAEKQKEAKKMHES